MSKSELENHTDFVARTRLALVHCSELWADSALQERLTVALSPRLRRSLGRCYPERGVVHIAPIVLQLPDELQHEIICHEAAHLVAWERYGRSQSPHGPGWKELMRAVGLEPRARVRSHWVPAGFVAKGTAAARPLFEHRCPVCQAVRTARRKMLRWRCRDCVTVGLPGEMVITPLGRSGLPL